MPILPTPTSTLGMDMQTAFNIAFALAGGAGGWLLKLLHEVQRDLQREHRALQAADAELAEKVHRIDVLVAGQYVTREDLQQHLDRVTAQLDRIELKLDTKVDKPA